MAEGGQDSSCAVVAGGNRARTRDLQNHAEACEELPQRRFPTRRTAGLFRRGQSSQARRDSSLCTKRRRNETLLARRNRDDAEGSFGAVNNGCGDRGLHRAAPGRTAWSYVGVL